MLLVFLVFCYQFPQVVNGVLGKKRFDFQFHIASDVSEP